jgi:hypothetical protein
VPLAELALRHCGLKWPSAWLGPPAGGGVGVGVGVGVTAAASWVRLVAVDVAVGVELTGEALPLAPPKFELLQPVMDASSIPVASADGAHSKRDIISYPAGEGS